MTRMACLVVVVAITLGGPATAQFRPDFSGTWRGPSAALTIKQNATTLTVTKGSETKTYNLDGSEARWTSGSGSQYTAKTRWVQSALVIETTTAAGNTGTWTDLEVYSMDHGREYARPQLSVVYVFTRETGGMMGTETTTYTKN